MKKRSATNLLIVAILLVSVLAGCREKEKAGKNIFYLDSAKKEITATRYGMDHYGGESGEEFDFVEIYLSAPDTSGDDWFADLYCSINMFGRSVSLTAVPDEENYFISYTLYCNNYRYNGGMDTETPDNPYFDADDIRSGTMKVVHKDGNSFEITLDIVTTDGKKAGLYYSGAVTPMGNVNWN